MEIGQNTWAMYILTKIIALTENKTGSHCMIFLLQLDLIKVFSFFY